MTSYVARHNAGKKKDQLDLRKQVLVNAIINNLAVVTIEKKAEKYKSARILYYKAILHVIREKEWQKMLHNYDKEKTLEEIENWNQKSITEIIEEINEELKLLK